MLTAITIYCIYKAIQGKPVSVKDIKELKSKLYFVYRDAISFLFPLKV